MLERKITDSGSPRSAPRQDMSQREADLQNPANQLVLEPSQTQRRIAEEYRGAV
jgi:hypothetical protein